MNPEDQTENGSLSPVDTPDQGAPEGSRNGSDLDQPAQDQPENGSAVRAEGSEDGEPEGSRNGFDPDRMKAVLEAVLYVSDQPLSLERMASVMGDCSRKDVRALIDELNTEYLERGRAFEIVEVANGYQVRTRVEFAPWIGKLQPQKAVRLTRAALESLAIIAYRQPVTRAEVESIRGVDTGAVIGSLLEKRLVRILGRKEVAGRPILYGTAQEFLDLFGLKNLGSLPTLREIEGMFEEKEAAVPAEIPADSAAIGDAGVGIRVEAPAGRLGSVEDPSGRPAERKEVRVEGRVGSVGSTQTAAEMDAGIAPVRSRDQESPGEHGEEVDQEEWDPDEGDLETAELDALLRAAKTKILSYEESIEKDAEAGAESEERFQEEGGQEDEDLGPGKIRSGKAPWKKEHAGGQEHARKSWRKDSASDDEDEPD